MLKAFQDTSILASSDSLDGEFVSVEAWKYVDSATGAAAHSIDFKRVPQADVGDWAWQRKSYKPKQSTSSEKLDGGIRLLLAQRKSPWSVSIVPGALLPNKTLEALHFPAWTFTSFQQPSGTFSCHTDPKRTRLALILRTPQKWECSIGGLALSHDFATGITSALSCGYAFDLHEFTSTPPFPLVALIDQLKECQDLWSHPMTLPCLFLGDHSRRTRSYVLNKVSHQVVQLEHSVGVTTAGHAAMKNHDAPIITSVADESRLFVDDHLQRDNAKRLTEAINDLSTRIIFAKRSPQWSIDCVTFLLRLLETNPKLAHAYRDIPSDSFHETLEYIRNYSEACLEVTQTSAERMRLQLNILYTSIAQDDGQTSARLAASAGKDSTSMKIIALITAAYLPGTFVATLFSMGMFSWQGLDGLESVRHVSSDFWIYWAVTVPLTIVTISGWALWWRIEKQRFERDVRIAVQDRSSTSGDLLHKVTKRRPWKRDGDEA